MVVCYSSQRKLIHDCNGKTLIFLAEQGKTQFFPTVCFSPVRLLDYSHNSSFLTLLVTKYVVVSPPPTTISRTPTGYPRIQPNSDIIYPEGAQFHRTTPSLHFRCQLSIFCSNEMTPDGRCSSKKTKHD